MAETALTALQNSEAVQCELWRAQAEALHQLGHAPEAETAAAMALRLAEKLHAADPERQTLPWIWALDSAGHPDDASRAAREYVQRVIRNDYPTARWRREQVLARILARNGQTRESVALIKALLADPKNSAPL